MRIFVDENIPSVTATVLRASGYDVRDIRGTRDEGMTDEKIWQLVQDENRLLITTDKGFSKYRNEHHHGILIIRLRKPNKNKIHERIMQALNQFEKEKWDGLLVVIRDAVQSVWKANPPNI